MTRIDLSPEQRDAMAAGPKERPLDELIEDHRARSTLNLLRDLFKDETLIEQLTVDFPPVLHPVIEKKGSHLDYDKARMVDVYKVSEAMEPADQNGRNLSAPMVNLIGGIRVDASFYNPRSQPIRKALGEFEQRCRRDHRGRNWWDHETKPICAEMLRAVVEHGTTSFWAIDRIGHLAGTWSHYQRGERLIAAGAEYVWKWLEHWDHERLEIGFEPDCRVCRERQAPVKVDAA